MSLASADSKAVFKARVLETDLRTIMAKLETLGWTSYGAFAFASGYNPVSGKPDDFDAIAIKVLGSADHALAAELRRLHFESFHHFMNELKERTKHPDDETRPMKLPLPERANRLATLQKKFPGLNFTGELEPSHALVNKLVTMRASGLLRHIRWEELTRRDKEVKNEGKVEEFLKVEDNGVLRKVTQALESPTDVSTDYALKVALQRRGAAMHLSEVMSFDKHEVLVERYFEAMRRDRMADYAKVTIQQVLHADVELFTRLAKLTEAGLVMGTNGAMPLDAHLDTIMKEMEFNLLLAPRQLPIGTKRGAEEMEQPSSSAGISKTQQKRKNQELNRMLREATIGKGGKSQGKKNPSAKKPAKGNFPAELENFKSKFEGQKVCFAFNMGGCKDGKNCKRGSHICMRCNSSSCQNGARNCRK